MQHILLRTGAPSLALFFRGLFMTYYFETYGCEMNKAESAAAEQLLLARGWTKALNEQVADLVIINTCSVRATAESRIVGRLGYYTGLKALRAGTPGAKDKTLDDAARLIAEKGPVPLTLVVMGCMAQRLLHTLKEQFPVVDYVVGTYAKNSLGTIVTAVERGQKPFELDEGPAYSFASLSVEQGAFSSFVPIMNGCNNFCTYCIVPYVRGREVSRPLSQIKTELDQLSQRGVKEITLLGQNVNSYNSDGLTFPALLEAISNHLEKTNSSIKWIRFESSHPKDLSDELIHVIAKNPYVCKGIHLPVQHGSSQILKRMNRRYSREDYLCLVQRMKENISDLSLITDIMVGFPGETEEDVEQVLSLMDEVQYQSAFMYYFNPREGTPAAKYEDQIDIEIKKARLQKIIDKQLSITTAVLSKRVGKTVTVLADAVSRDNSAELLGKTEQNERVAFAAEKSLIGGFCTVHLDCLSGNTFRGTIV